MSIPDFPNCSANSQEFHACQTVAVKPVQGSVAAPQFTAQKFTALMFAALLFSTMMIVANNVSANSIVALDESAELTSRLLKAFKELPADYEPRTEHFGADGAPEFINRLVAEDSPYLLQHAHNPVNWFPWGQEAFERAVSENKPVFLSIGYATCHWCHVMERESFENKEIADIINEHFIAIKVDREQRPDVDSTYMTAVQMMTGGGGWPLSSFLVPTSSPFYGGTYYPPETFKDLLLQINTAWMDKEQEVVDQASRVAAALVEVNQTSAKAREVGEKEIEAGVRMLLRGFDDLQGGFGQAPKFPREPALYLLLENAARTGNTEVLYAAYFTLQRIAAGGIHDHVAGGFHRYAVDNDWLVPHFEKMLYNQAALSRNFVQSWQLTADQEHGRVARRVLDYVAREMTSTDGGFYSATDADSEGHEGVFFIWTPAQLTEALGAEDAKLASTIWSTSEEGNFEGSNILHLQGTITELANNLKMPVAELTSKIDQMSEKLLQVRGKRIAPLLDDKVITAWNGMMITAFAEAGSAMNEQRYIDIAVKAANSILKTNSPETGVLWRTSYAGRSSVPANQADYAFLAEAFLALYDATGDAQWLEQAEKLAETMDSRFLDTDNGGYFMGSPVVAGASMPVRPKELFDNATPSGNSVAMRVLSGLYYRTGNDTYREKAEALLTAFSDQLVNQPESQAYLLKAVSELLYGEGGETQYTARGKVRVQARIVPSENSASGGETLQLSVSMQEGWHINANKPLQKYLIGTTITHTDGSEIAGVKYPEPILAKLGFERSELALYEEAVVIEVALDAIDMGEQLTDAERPGPALAVVPVSINLQACNDTVCLAPETLTLKPSVALARAAAL